MRCKSFIVGEFYLARAVWFSKDKLYPGDTEPRVFKFFLLHVLSKTGDANVSKHICFVLGGIFLVFVVHV